MDDNNNDEETGGVAAASDLDEDDLPAKLQEFLSSVGIVNLPSPSSARDGDDNDDTEEDDDDDQEEVEDEEYDDIFESSFDLSEERLRYFFHLFDTDEDGRISYDSLKQGLLYYNVVEESPSCDDAAFDSLVHQHLDLDQSGDLDYDEFADGIRLMMLKALFHTSSDSSTAQQSAQLFVIDYDSIRLERRLMVHDQAQQQSLSQRLTSSKRLGSTTTSHSNGTSATPSQLALLSNHVSPIRHVPQTHLFFHSRNRNNTNKTMKKKMDDWIRVRWINVTPHSESAAALTMKRLAVKFSLHPLALEDALTPDSHRPKVESFANHYLLMVPIITLDATPFLIASERPQHGSTRHRLNRLLLAIRRLVVACTPKTSRTSKSVQHLKASIKRPDRAPKVDIHMSSVFIMVPENDTVITLNPPNRKSPWNRVQRELEKRYSKLRQYDAQYLVYALLDHAVDLLSPVVKHFREAIRAEGQYLEQVCFVGNNLSRVHAMRHELERMSQKLKPFLRLLYHVIEDEAISPGATLYLKDVLDNLEVFEEEMLSLVEECRGLDALSDKYQSRQMDQTLYMLTVISSVFLPAQFLTGVWGMNFTNMPELDKTWAYPTFWALTICMIVILLVVLNFGRLRR